MNRRRARKKVVVLASGGMDSTVALYESARTLKVIAAFSFEYGSKHNHREIPFAREHCRNLGIPHDVIRLDFINDLFQSHLLESGGQIPDGRYDERTMRQTVVPFRNGIMLAVAAGIAECRQAQGLVIAAHAGDHAIYPDCRNDFMESMARAVRLGTYAQIEVIRPFQTMTKAQIAARGHALGVDFARTWSCYKGGDVHCGKCGSCVERREAFVLARIPDPTKYRNADVPPMAPDRIED